MPRQKRVFPKTRFCHLDEQAIKLQSKVDIPFSTWHVLRPNPTCKFGQRPSPNLDILVLKVFQELNFLHLSIMAKSWHHDRV
jgi:hypothetical protein